MRIILKIILFPIAIIFLLLGLAIASVGSIIQILLRFVTLFLSGATLFYFYEFFKKSGDLSSALLFLVMLMASIGIDLLIQFAPELFMTVSGFIFEL